MGILLSGLIALVFGAISLRTKGVYFIMITLALAQMIFFLSISAERYGSDGRAEYSDPQRFRIGFFSRTTS